MWATPSQKSSSANAWNDNLRNGRPLLLPHWSRKGDFWAFCSTPIITPLLITTAEEETKGIEREGGAAASPQYAFYKIYHGWDLSGCGCRLGAQSWISAVYPALPVCFFPFYLSIPQTRWKPSKPYSLIPTNCGLRLIKKREEVKNAIQHSSIKLMLAIYSITNGVWHNEHNTWL